MCILRANRALLYYIICRSRLQKRNRSRKICISTGLFHITFTLHSSGIQIVTYYWGLNASFLYQNENELNPSLLIRDCSFCGNMNQKFHFFCLGLPPQICIKCVVFQSKCLQFYHNSLLKLLQRFNFVYIKSYLLYYKTRLSLVFSEHGCLNRLF